MITFKPIREDKVQMLVAAAHRGLEASLDDCTASEVFSAYLTMMANIIHVMHEMKVPARTLRGAVEQLLLRCPGESERLN